LSAGTFVSALVVGFVAIYAAPFNVDPASFIRDVGFYLLGALILFYVYLSGEIFFWQAVGFVGFYLFFVGFVFWMDLGSGSIAAAGGAGGDDRRDAREMDCERGGEVVVGSLAGEKEHSGCFERAYGKVMPCDLACVFPSFFFFLSVGLSSFSINGMLFVLF
jgi:sodium/potassium/calcium exchanger 6